MKQDTNKTVVEFYFHEENQDLLAFFPNNQESKGFFLSYCHIGQHSECSLNYIKECRKATIKEYTPLKTELESIGYNLKINE